MSRQSQFCKNLIKGEGGESALNCPVITFISHLVVLRSITSPPDQDPSLHSQVECAQSY